MPAAIGGDQQHLKAIGDLARVIQVLDQHRLRPTGQQRPSHGQAIEQRLRLAPGEAVQLQLVGAQDVRHRHGFFEQEVADFSGHAATLFRMPHHRVAQVQRLGVGRLDPRDTTENRPPLRGAAQVTGQHRVAVAQLADGGDALYQLGNPMGCQDFSGPLSILSVVGELHRIQRPDVHPDPLHRKNRSAVAGMAKDHMGLDRKQMRGTFHARIFRKTIEIQAAQYATKRSLYDRPERQLS